MADNEYFEGGEEIIGPEAKEESILDKIRKFFQIGKEPKTIFQVISLVVGVVLLVIAFLNFSAWQKGEIDSGIYLCISFFSFVGVGTYLGGEPKIIGVIAVLLFLFVLGLMLFGKNPADFYSEKPKIVQIDGATVIRSSDYKYEVILNKTNNFVDVGQAIFPDGIWPAGKKLVFSGFKNGQIERETVGGSVFSQPPNIGSWNNISLPLMLRSKEQGVKVIITLQ